MNKDDIQKGVIQRVSTVRVRTWTLTLMISIALVLYFLVNVITKQKMDWIDFVFMATIQILIHCLYFPDGDLYGQKDEGYIKNKAAYNEKAEKITDNHLQAKLREYCKVEYERRRDRYIETELSYLNITPKEYEMLKQKTEKEIKELEKFEYQDGEEMKAVCFNKSRRKRLYRLLFEPIPVAPNEPETITSALEQNHNSAIRDGSIGYRTREYVKRFLMATIFGAFLAYIGYTLKDGISFADIVKIVVDLSTLMSTAVMSFSSGETCSKVYKKNFYINLSNFIDGFMEWNGTI